MSTVTNPNREPAEGLPGSFHEVITDLGPPELERASRRLQFSPSYVIVGIYRLVTDKSLYGPAWDKCKHGTQRGLVAGFLWTCVSFHIQRKFIKLFLIHSARVTGLSNDTAFGQSIPFDLPTYAAIITLGSQVTTIISFFLSHNIRIARDRAWAQTVASRGKGPDFWQPYVEEWEFPPFVDESSQGIISKAFESSLGRFILKKWILFPISLYPFVGIFVSAYLKAIGTARYLHKPYFEAKKMTRHQVAVFMEERKWDYQLFGFTAALLESLPVIGLIFTVSNRIGAAMWAHDLEKRQHFVATRRLRKDGAGAGVSPPNAR